MITYGLIALGGAAGGLARYSVTVGIRNAGFDTWPLATLLVNILGSLGIGIVVILLERNAVHAEVRSVLMIGFFGAFTTFSTFSLELFQMLERGHIFYAVGYGLASVLACLLGVSCGVILARAMT